MAEVEIVERVYKCDSVMTNEEFKNIVFSNLVIDKILRAVNKRLGLIE